MSEDFKIRPYARLLTMLGEQLIKNECIALMELIKNSYDADASWVRVSFINFGDDFEIQDDSKIVIEDDGSGMTYDTITKHWMNPATPDKKIKRNEGKAVTPKKKRVIQGEKGIGRFAMLKLGKTVNVITRPELSPIEYEITYDFRKYDNDFLTLNEKPTELFLEDLSINLDSHPAKYIVESPLTLGIHSTIREPHGTKIEIGALKGIWTKQKIETIFQDISSLTSSFESIVNISLNQNGEIIKNDDFQILLYKENEMLNFQQGFDEKLIILLTERAVFRLESGEFNAKEKTFTYLENGHKKCLSIRDPHFTGLRTFSKHFGKGGEILDKRNIECGSFHFGFYIFDFSSKAAPSHKLDAEDKQIIKRHRIYLYRDNVRVYPYGEPDDDWLKIDAYRGTISAGDFLSNDQVVGYINITSEANPRLKDKTNREGLIEDGNATEDFIVLI